MTTAWVDGFGFEVGEAVFLKRVHHVMDGGRERLVIDSRPAITNQSREPRLFGWCGTTNDVALYGDGVGRVVRVTKNDRAQVKCLFGDEQAAALEELGYPEMAP
jgi:hypothetical protein